MAHPFFAEYEQSTLICFACNDENNGREDDRQPATAQPDDRICCATWTDVSNGVKKKLPLRSAQVVEAVGKICTSLQMVPKTMPNTRVPFCEIGPRLSRHDFKNSQT